MKSSVRLSALVACAAVLSACASFESLTQGSRIEYKSAGKLPPLDIPPDLVGPRADERFSIPDRVQPGQRTLSGFQGARPAERPSADSARVLPSVEGMRVERSGNQRWLVVNLPPDRVYPLVREFWQESGFLVQTEMPEAGILETDWAENRAKVPQDFIRNALGRVLDSLYSTGERDKFRTRLEPAAGGGTEIFITHRGLTEVFSTQNRDSTVWTPRPADPELEAEFLRRMLVKLGADQTRASTQVAAASVAPGATPVASDRTRMVGAGGSQELVVREGFDRAWRRVGLALDRGGFTVEDRDRSQGVYYVRYIDHEVEAKGSGQPGLLARLFNFGDKRATSAQQYRVKVAGQGEVTQVAVLLKDGQPVTSEQDRQTNAKILNLLREQLAL